MRFNWKKLYQALDALRVDSGGGSWRHLATQSGVTPSLFTRISQGKPTSVGNLLKLLEIGRYQLSQFVEVKKARTK